MDISLNDCLRWKEGVLQVMCFVPTGEFEKQGWLDKLLGVPRRPKYKQVWFDVKEAKDDTQGT